MGGGLAFLLELERSQLMTVAGASVEGFPIIGNLLTNDGLMIGK